MKKYLRIFVFFIAFGLFTASCEVTGEEVTPADLSASSCPDCYDGGNDDYGGGEGGAPPR